jgi:predicted dehydrogenase
MIKALIIGCGKIAGNNELGNLNTHAGAYSNLDNAKIVGCIDKDHNKAKIFSEQYNCPAENDIKLCLKKYIPDVVSVCSSDNTHFEITKKILNSNNPPKVIFLEKPICHSKTELDILIDLSLKKNVDVVVNFTRRFDQNYITMRDRILDNYFGILRNVYATYYSGWEHNAIHHVDTLNFLFDAEIMLIDLVNSKNSKYSLDPSLSFNAKFVKKPGKIYFNTFDENDYQLFDLELQFDKSRVRFEDFGARIIVEKHHINSIGERVIKLQSNNLEVQTKTPMQNAINLICQSITNNQPELLNGLRLPDSVRTMKTIWQGKELYEKY